MPKTRTGARTFLEDIRHACKLSHTPGFVGGLRTILGTADADTLYALWTPFCSLVESFIAADDYFNKQDWNEETTGSEDIAGE